MRPNLVHYGPEEFAKDVDVSRETLDKLSAYAEALRKWQRAKNLVSNATIDDMWRRHFLDSAQLAPLIREAHPDKNLDILDIGSGAGFPGLVLAIMGVGTSHMVESNGRKCVFMNQVSRETSAPVHIENVRIEDLAARQFDIVTSRACAKIIQLLEWSAPFLGPATEMWLLKGEIAEEELTEAATSWNMKIKRHKSLSDPTGIILRLSCINKK